MPNSLYQLRVKNRRGVVTVTAIESAGPGKRYVNRQLKITPTEFDALLKNDGITKWLAGIVPERRPIG